MKKIVVFGLCCAAALGMAAQESLVKDVERQLKSNIETYPKVVGQLDAAFSDPTTKDTAYPYFVAGKGGVDYYDHSDALKRIGKEVNVKDMSYGMIDGCLNLINAVKYDTIVDAKGKVKTKYSKDAVKLINSHFTDVSNAGVYLWGIQDYDGAYRAWDLYTSLPTNPVLGKNAPAMPADTIMADMFFNKALAAWQSERLPEALAAFDQSIAMGYDKPQAYDYAISVSSQMKDTGKMAQYAEKAYNKFNDSKYIGFIVNDKMENQKFDEAQKMIEEYIAASPNDSQLYYVLGVIYERRSSDAAEAKADPRADLKLAAANFKKAAELNPESVAALLQYGNALYRLAYAEVDANEGLPTQEYNKFRTEVVDPLFNEAIPVLEKAYQLDPEGDGYQSLTILRSIYYNLEDQENLKRIESLI